jgi:hypothetical protein
MEAVLAETGAGWACVIMSPVLPRGRLTAADEASAKALASERRQARLRRFLVTAGAGLGISGALAGAAAADPAPPASANDPLFQAVFNAGGGEVRSEGFGSGEVSGGLYSNLYGQLDGKGFFASHLNGGGGALQGGLRDPEHYRAGVFVAGGSAGGGSGFWEGGGYVDLFVQQLNLRLDARDFSATHGSSKAFFGGGADFYVNDDTKVFGKVESDGHDTFGDAGLEHAFQGLSGLSLGAAGTFGPDQGGFRVYAKYWFGASGETLKHHDRYGPAKSVLDDGWFVEARRLRHHATYGGSSTPGGGGV